MKIRPSPFISYDDYDFEQSEPFDLWNDASQYSPIPGNFDRSPASPSNTSCTKIDAASLLITSLSNKLLRKRIAFSCSNLVTRRKVWRMIRIHQPVFTNLIEWKVTLNNRTVAKDTEQDLALAPRFYWRLFFQPKLKELLTRKYPQRKLGSDDTSVVISATR